MAQDSERQQDPRVERVARAIHRFDWGDFGLDEVGMIRWAEADYARALARKVLRELDGEASS